jgi:hypothetical protein
MNLSFPLRATLGVGAMFLTATAQAQSLNIDLGIAGDAPAAIFGAAAGQAGTWNDVGVPANAALVDLAGAAVAAVIDYNGNGVGRFFQNPATNGNDEKLMDDVLDLGPGGFGTLTIGPLSAGVYDVYLYAMSPDTATDSTIIGVHDAIDPTPNCAGAFNGYAAGVTHVVARTVVEANGTLTIDVGTAAGNGSVNGIQIVKDPAGMKLGRKMNIDVGLAPPNHPKPANNYGAAAAQAGFWNALGGPGGAVVLADLNGAATDVRASVTGGGWTQWNDPATNGNDEALMDDYHDVGPLNFVRTWTLGPFAKGTYDVYSYGWDPFANANKTSIKVLGGQAAAAQVCGGAAFAGFAAGNTHVIERVVLAANGNLKIEAKTTQGNGCINGFQIVEVVQVTQTYCTPGTSSSGCTASISGIGVPSASATSGFVLQVSGVESQKLGLLFYGASGRTAASWSAGSSSYLCVKSPTQRLAPQNSGGSLWMCDGSLSADWSAYMASHPSALGHPLYAGQVFDAQAWYRDPPAAKTTNLSDGLEFTIQP